MVELFFGIFHENFCHSLIYLFFFNFHVYYKSSVSEFKKKAIEVLAHYLFQYKSSQNKRIQNQFIYMNIHVYSRQYQKKLKKEHLLLALTLLYNLPS